MNYRMIGYMTGHIVRLESALLLLPALTALIYGESCIWAILITAFFSLIFGFALTKLCKPKSTIIYAPEGFVITALAWILMSAVGALPFVIAGEIPSYIDAFFEIVSGFTTTGASILTDVEALSRGLLFWRSFTHWIGGMGVLVLIMAILPSGSGRDIHIMRAEMPGPVVGKLVPRVRTTAFILYVLYIVLTLIEVVFLLAGGMPFFDSIVHTFGTAGTGGFGIKGDSIASYSPYLQWVITIFMILFGVNFNLYYLLAIRRFKAVLISSELWCYLAICFGSIAIITVNILSYFPTFGDSLRAAAFQVASIITTTGYATADFNLWPQLSRTLLLGLMLIGACAGSTAGGLKVSRVMLLVKIAGRNLKSLLHPRSVSVITLEGKTVDDATIANTSAYLTLYMICTVVITFLLGFGPFDLETNLSATIACFNNIGPGLGVVGPTGNYFGYPGWAKLLLSVAMLMGRLEIYPIILAFHALILPARRK